MRSKKKIIISGTGCALGDFLYDGISFSGTEFQKYISKNAGDGGLNPGKLVFTEELEEFSGCYYKDILKEIAGGNHPAAFNVGGPSVVSLIHASQLLQVDEFKVKFFGMSGSDEIAGLIRNIVNNTPLDIENYLNKSARATPFTDVFSDPDFNGGHGERTFVNNIGAAWDYSPDMLSDDFFNSDIVCFGGTALVPQIHNNLTGLLKKARQQGCITVVNTVFDFLNEKASPDHQWPLDQTKVSLGLIDLLIMDKEEALRISGQKDLNNAALFFKSSNVASFIITNGPDDVYAWSDGRFFKKSGLINLPVSGKVKDDLKTRPELKGDTTGCGDNFAGGVISSVAMQLKSKKPGELDMIEAISLGVASGGFCCYMLGGTYLEKFPGEKRSKVIELQNDYLKEISMLPDLVEKKKLVLFGAGKIGRSFIGQLFSKSGFKVVFIDINKKLIDELNRRRSYNVVIKGAEEQILNIENVSGVCLSDDDEVIHEVATAGIVATSVGSAGLNSVFPLLAQGLLQRYCRYSYPLDIIIAENMRNADVFFRDQLQSLLPPDFPFTEMTGLIETSIGKMVPIMQRKDVEEDILQVFAEPYNTLIINKKGFRNGIPEVKGLAPRENMKAWVDRKLFIHNLGHSAAAYLGYLYNPDFTYLYEALAVPEILKFVRAAMLQSADILLKMYPGEFTCESLSEHIEDLILRFQNKALGDTIFRVGCDLKRKLGAEDRLAGAIHNAFENKLPYDRILLALVCGCFFRALDEDGKVLPDDQDFAARFANAINRLLTSVCGFDKHKHNVIIKEAISIHTMIERAGLIGRPVAVNKMLVDYLYSHNPVSG